jgi:hypothetical protein
MIEPLSTLKVGHDVPWVTSWTGEALLGVGRCAVLGGRLAIGQVQDPGRGKPQYSKNHMVRQRLSVLRMLCPMCGKPTQAQDRWTEVAKRTAAGDLRSRGVVMPGEIADDMVLLDAGSIAPLHRRCLDRSLLHCPHLRGSPDVHVMRFPKAWTVVPLTVEVDAMDGRTPTVIGFLQICGVTRTVDRRWRREMSNVS